MSISQVSSGNMSCARTPMLRFFTWDRVRIFVAVALLFAAFAKFLQVFQSDKSLLFALGGVRWTFLLVAFEIGFAAAVLIKGRSHAVRFFTMALLGIFAALNLGLWFVGQSKCECFGAIGMPPMAAFLFDVALLLSVILSCYIKADTSTTEPTLQFWALGLLATMFSIFACSEGTKAGREFSARLRGDLIISAQLCYSLGIREPTESVDFPVDVLNASKHSVRIIGFRTNCTCKNVLGLPIEIPSGEEVQLWVSVRTTKQTGVGAGVIELVYDSDDYRIGRIPYVFLVRPRVDFFSSLFL